MANRKKRKSRKRRSTKRKTKKRKSRKRKFPKNPKKGQRKSITSRGRKITFEASGKKGFGAWNIVSNVKA